MSVRNRHEATAAVAGGADLIDVKDPSRGALGRPDPKAIVAVVQEVAGRRPVSVALGELNDIDDCDLSHHDWLENVGLIKVGLAGCWGNREWRVRLATVAHGLPPASLVPVHYADWQTCGAPPFRAVLEAAVHCGSSTLLVDTHDKAGGRLLDLLSVAELRELVAASHRAGLACAVAGRLRIEDIPLVHRAEPNVVGVRTAACERGEREAAISASRVTELRGALGIEIDENT